jgi:hypothetical protein
MKKNHTKRTITRKKMRKTKRRISLKKMSKTKRMYGNGLGNFFNNIFGVIKNDKNTKGNFYETKISVNEKEYNINYFTPSNYLVFKSTDQLITPTFSLYLDKESSAPTNITIKIGEYVINSIVIIESKWYAIIRSLEKIKNLNISSFYYKIKSGVFSNKNEKLYVNKNKYKIEQNSIVLKESEYQKLEDSKDTAYLILRNFYIQQEAGELGKEALAFEVAEKVGDEIFAPEEVVYDDFPDF